MELGSKYKSEGNAQDLQKLIQMIRPFTKLLSKAKAAKLVRGLVDMYLDMETTTGCEVELCKECIQWAMEDLSTCTLTWRQRPVVRWSCAKSVS